MLGQFGLRLEDWSGRIDVLSDRKGRTAVVENLGALWVQAELRHRADGALAAAADPVRVRLHRLDRGEARR